MSINRAAAAFGVASLLGMVLLAGCADAAPRKTLDQSTIDSSPFGPPQVPSAYPGEDSGSPGPTPTPAASSQASGARVPAGEIDTTGWKSFSTQGVGFRYPADWNIEEDDCSDCNSTAKALADPFAKWDLENSDGDEIAEFRADSATDTDGDIATYTRTVLESTPLDAGFHQPAEVLFEHMVIQAPGKKTEQKVVLMINDSAAIKARGERPALDFFTPLKGLASQMASTDDLAEELGFDDDQVSLDDARKIMRSKEYRQLRAVMLSVRIQK